MKALLRSIVRHGLPVLAVSAFLLAQPKPKPTPRSPIKQAYKPTHMTVTASTKMPGEKEHCFLGDNTRSLYFTITPDIPADKANVDLYDLGNFSAPPALVEQQDGAIKSGAVTIEIPGDVKLTSAAKTTPTVKTNLLQHLGPGPYVAVVSATTSTGARNGAGIIVGVSRYYYETFQSDPKECSH